MKPFLAVPVLLAVVCLGPTQSRTSQHDIWFHPMVAQADRAGAQPTVLVVDSNDTFGAGLIIEANQVVSDNDFEWVSIPLTLPTTGPNGRPWKIEDLELFYDTGTISRSTFISQVRLAEMTTPDHATVRHDDATDLRSSAPTSYVSHVGGVPINGAFELSLRIAIGDPKDRIRIGGIRISLSE